MTGLVGQDQVGLERNEQFEIDGGFFTDIGDFGHLLGNVIVPGIAQPGLGRADRGDANGQQGLGAFIGQNDNALRIVRYIGHAHGVGDVAGVCRHGHGAGNDGRGNEQVRTLHLSLS